MGPQNCSSVALACCEKVYFICARIWAATASAFGIPGLPRELGAAERSCMSARPWALHSRDVSHKALAWVKEVRFWLMRGDAPALYAAGSLEAATIVPMVKLLALRPALETGSTYGCSRHAMTGAATAGVPHLPLAGVSLGRMLTKLQWSAGGRATPPHYTAPGSISRVPCGTSPRRR